MKTILRESHLPYFFPFFFSFLLSFLSAVVSFGGFTRCLSFGISSPILSMICFFVCTSLWTKVPSGLFSVRHGDPSAVEEVLRRVDVVRIEDLPLRVDLRVHCGGWPRRHLRARLPVPLP